MAADLSRIPRTKQELENFLERNFEEYHQAYLNIRPGQGWRIELYETEVFRMMDTLYAGLYESLYPKLQREYSASDREIVDLVRALVKWTKKENGLFKRIAKNNGHGVLVNVEAIVQELLLRAYYKFTEAILLAKEEQTKNLKHLSSDNAGSVKSEYLIGIITATTEEFTSAKSFLNNPKLLPLIPEDSHIYTKGLFENSAKRLSVVITQTLDQGSAASAVATSQMIRTHNPDFLVMLGHAAGNKNLMRTTGLGDILIAKEAFDYGQVSIVEKLNNGNVVYVEKDKKRPIEADKTLVTLLTQFSEDHTFLEHIKSGYAASSLFSNPLKVHFGSIASGNALVRSESWFDKIVAANTGTIGLEMEAYGFYFAAVNTRFKDKPLFVAIKSVSDFGSHNTTYPPSLKAPLHRIGYATYTSAKFFYEFALKHLPI